MVQLCRMSSLCQPVAALHSSARRQKLANILHRTSASRLFLSTTTTTFTSEKDEKIRKTLKFELEALGIDADSLRLASLQSVRDPTKGFDPAFGKSAIKAYRSFCKRQKTGVDLSESSVAAQRCARQVDFLIKRHKSREAEWVRHIDTKEERTVHPILLVLDNVRSAFNVGSLFRTADATGCAMVLTVGITPHPAGSGAEKLEKSALGAERIVPTRHFDTMPEAIDYIASKHPAYTLVGMETTDRSTSYTDTDVYQRKGTALILGNEVTGVDTEIMPRLDAMVEIPMYGRKNSLNVAACAPVVLYEMLRQWNCEPS